MSVSITIHRGTKQIGGSITEIATERNRILIDFGSELSKNANTHDDQEMIKIITKNRCDGVFFTHYHGDHTGLINNIPKEVPIYMGNVARLVMLNIKKALKLKNEADMLKDTNHIKSLEKGMTIEIGDIKVTPYFVDHSAYDAYMLLIEADGKRILHTGDFRTHGRLGKGLLPTLKHYVCKDGRTIDVLITEGTMMNRRSEEEIMTENKLQMKATELLKQHRYAFLVCSSTNLDSLASFHKAAKKNNIPMFANWYVVNQCKTFTESAGEIVDIYKFDKLYKLDLKRVLSNNLSQEEHMRRCGFLLMVKESDKYQEIMETFRDLDPILIYSLWNGYIDEKCEAYNEKLHEMVKRWETVCLHTSGHATAETLTKVIMTIKPQEAIIPIHTEMAEKFNDLPISQFKSKVLCLNDGEAWIL